MTRLTAVVFILLGLYLLLSLLSTITSEYATESWLGIYMLYEGYLALVGYVVVFAAAWYWIDRKEVLDFVKSCLTVLSIVLGVLALLERSGICYYNSAIVQFLGGLQGTVGVGDAVSLTFGNADYLGMYCAMLLPVVVFADYPRGTTKTFTGTDSGSGSAGNGTVALQGHECDSAGLWTDSCLSADLGIPHQLEADSQRLPLRCYCRRSGFWQCRIPVEPER